MIRTIQGQTVGSTNPDSHGERYDRAFWEDFLSAMPARAPLHQEHDMSRPICGHMENFRLQPDPEHLGEWLVVCDVTYDDEKVVDPRAGAFSWSATVRMASNTEDCHTFVYLPYPYYNDADLLQAILLHDDSLGVGKWLKKKLDPTEVGLIIASATLVLGPAWTAIYNNTIHPQFTRLFARCKDLLWSRGVSTDLIQACMIPHNNRRVALNFVPTRGAEEACFSQERIVEAIELARIELESDWGQHHEEVDRLVLLFDDARQAYKIDRIHYANGKVRPL